MTDEKCDEVLEIESEYGDDKCIFKCQKLPNHTGCHAESGSSNGKDYRIEWE